MHGLTDIYMAAAAPVGAPAGTRFLPFVFEVHGGCTDDAKREIRHLLSAWSPSKKTATTTRPAAPSTATPGGTTASPACSMLAHAVQAQVLWLAEPMPPSG